MSRFSTSPIQVIRQVMKGPCGFKLSILQLYDRVESVYNPLLISLARQNPEICVTDDYRVYITDHGFVRRIGSKTYKQRCEDHTKNYRYIFVPIHISFEKEYRMKPIQGRSGHSTSVIIDIQNETIQYFEPNGPDVSWHEPISKFMEKELTNDYPNYSFIPTEEFCPLRGPQRISGLPTCAAFTLFFLWSRIVDPDLESEVLVNELVKYDRDRLQTLIVKFICHLHHYAQYLNLFQLREIYDSLDIIVKSDHLEQQVLELYNQEKLEELKELKDRLDAINSLYSVIIHKIDREELYDELDILYENLDIRGMEKLMAELNI